MVKDYQKGKIYKIYSLNGTAEDVYYGSTTQTLSRRMAKHRTDHKAKRTCTSCILLNKYDDCIIELVENYPCNSIEELNAREGYYHRNNPCVNKCIAGRTRKEYTEDNKEQIKEYYEKNKEHLKEQHKKWYVDNKEKITEQKKKWYEENKEKENERAKQWYEVNKEKANERVKQWYEVNKEKIKEKSKEKITCECGSEYIKVSKSRHERSQKHITKMMIKNPK